MAGWRKDGFRFVIRSNDHTPAHIHVFRERAEVVIFLGSLGEQKEKPSVRENRRMQTRDIMRALKICYENQKEYLEKWESIHGSK